MFNFTVKKRLKMCIIKETKRGEIMKKKIWTILGMIFSFLIPAFVFIFILREHEICPYGDATLLFVDSQGQYVSFLSYYRSIILTNNDFAYTFAKSLGGDMASLMCYYLFSPFNFIYLFFESNTLPLGISLVTTLKIGTIGLTMYILLNHLYKEKYLTNLIFSVSYSLCSYVIVYNFNFMFLDAVLWLPLVILGLEKMFEGHKATLYSVMLALAIISNYYTGFMTCIFVVMFFLYKLYSHKREKKDIKNYYKNFAIASVLAGVLSAITWLVAVINMSGSKTSFSHLSKFTMDTLWELPDFLKNFTSSSYKGMSDIISGGPLVFVGIVSFALAIMYFLNNKINKDERYGAGAILLVFIVCMTFSGLNNLFHGGAAPVWFPFRFAFLFDFFLIYLAAKEFYNMDGLKLHHFVLPCGIIMIIYAILSINHVETGIVTDFLILLFLLLMVAIFKYSKNRYVNGVGAFLLLLGTIYNLKGSANDNILTNVEEAENGSSNYLSYEKYQEQYEEINQVIQYVKNYDETGDLYRLEKTFNSLATYNLANNDSMMFDYAGLSHYSSVEKLATREYLANYLGFHQNGNWNSYGLGSTLSANSLLGVRYIIDRDYENNSIMIRNRHFGAREHLTNLKEFETSQDTISVFENPYALNIGFFGAANENTNIKYGIYDEEQQKYTYFYDIFEHQNNIYKALVGIDSLEDIFIPLSYTTSYTNVTVIDDTHYSLTNVAQPGYITYRVTLNQDYPCYYHIKPGFSEYMSLYQSAYSTNNLYYFNMYNYAINPIDSKSSTVTYTLKLNENLIWDNTEIVPSFYYENIDTLKQYISILKSNDIHLQKISSSHLKGTTTYDSKRPMINFSIAYDKKWQVKINNKRVATRPNQTLFLASDLTSLNLEDGQKINIEIKYQNSESTIAILIGLIAIAYIAFVDYELYKPIKNLINKKAKKSE